MHMRLDVTECDPPPPPLSSKLVASQQCTPQKGGGGGGGGIRMLKIETPILGLGEGERDVITGSVINLKHCCWTVGASVPLFLRVLIH